MMADRTAESSRRSAKHLRQQPLLRRKQKDPRGPGMDVAICRNFLMLADVGTFQPKRYDLPLFIDGKSSDQHYIARQICNFCIQVD